MRNIKLWWHQWRQWRHIDRIAKLRQWHQRCLQQGLRHRVRKEPQNLSRRCVSFWKPALASRKHFVDSWSSHNKDQGCTWFLKSSAYQRPQGPKDLCLTVLNLCLRGLKSHWHRESRQHSDGASWQQSLQAISTPWHWTSLDIQQLNAPICLMYCSAIFSTWPSS